MMPLAIIVAAVTFLLALINAYWGCGGVWPSADEASLARTVTGFSETDEMPPAPLAFIVAAAFAYTSLIALVLGGVIESPVPFFLLGPSALFITLTFLVRGVAGYTGAWRSRTPVQPFARLDRLVYSPLCLALGAGFFTLGIRGFSG